MDSEKRRLLISLIILIPIILLGDVLVGAIAIASGPLLPSNLCTTANTFCGPITYVTSVSGNNTGLATVTTSAWSAIANESMIVVGAVGASTIVHTMISNITDTLGDTFSQRLIQQFAAGSLDGNNIEIWFGQTKTSGSNALTAKWNFTDGVGTQILQANIYTGVSNTGASNSTSTLGPAASLTLKTAKSGSWIFGAMNIVNPICPPPAIGTSPQFIRRIDTCQALSGIGSVNEAESSDNATSLRNTFKLTYVPTGTGTQQDYAVIELVATDLEPSNPDFSTFCTATNTPCTYLNFVSKSTGANALANIVVGTTYCTGITTPGLTTTAIHSLQAISTYAGQSRNDTGAILAVEIYITTTAPPTTFGACTPVGGNVFGFGKIFFVTSGATLTQFGLNEYSTAVNGFCSNTGVICSAQSTFFAQLLIIPQSVGSGNLGSTIQYAQWGSGLSSSSLSMFEIK